VARITLRPLRGVDVAIVRRLLHLYLYDLGGERWDVEADGAYGPPGWHRRFWRRRGSHHFIVRVGGRPAGFALVRDHADFAGTDAIEISEFFVLRKYRRRGVGTRVALALFARFPGRWEVAVITWNPARRFWRGVIRRAAVGRVVARRRRRGDLTFVVWHFDTARPPARARAVSRAARRRRSGGRRSRSAGAGPSSA
jgi:predicted acetyltransferase